MIIFKKNTPYYQWGNNCDSWVLLDKEHLSIKQELMPPGSKEQLHYHVQAEQFFFILKGTAAFYVDDQKFILNEQEGISILPDSPHFIANESDAPLEFMVISQPNTQNDRVVPEKTA